jgi:anti-sigma B factor antagonist
MGIVVQPCDFTCKVTESFAGPVVKKTITDIFTEIDKGVIQCCTLNFSACTFIDSSGIGMLVSVAQQFHARNIRFVLKNLNNDLFELFVDTGLDRVFIIEKDGDIRNADVDLFATGVDVRLVITKTPIAEICIFSMSGIMNHPLGSQNFKQQFLLALADHKFILLDMDELTFFDSLSLSAVLAMNNLLSGTGGSMRICGANFIINDLFATLNINSIIPVFTTREEALLGWGSNHG